MPTPVPGNAMSDFVSGMIGAVVGAVASALASGSKDAVSALFRRKSNARYLAIRVVAVLDRYVDGCASVTGDDGLCDGQRNIDGRLEIQVETPTFDVQSLDVDWKSIPAELMFKVLSFPDLIEAARRKIIAASDYGGGDNEEAIETRRLQYADLGLQAEKLSQEFRRRYGIPARRFDEWDPVEYMRSAKDRFIDAQIERDKRHAVALSALEEPGPAAGA
jgi:hypothetical protein